jgi:cathepsin X
VPAGSGFDVFEYMHRYGLPDESCANYVAESSAECDAQAVCSNCMPLGEDVTVYKCWPVPSPILYYVHSYGSVHGEAAMMSEIIARGPITCGFASIDDFDYGYVRRTAAHRPTRCSPPSCCPSHSPLLPFVCE